MSKSANAASGAVFNLDSNRPKSPTATSFPAGVSEHDTGIKKHGAKTVELLGKDFNAVDKRKYKYDVLAGRAEAKPIGMTRDDRMGAEEAGAALDAIHAMCGLKGANEDVLDAFDRALWVCHTVNSGSSLVPGRARLSVPGMTRNFDYAMIKNKLGPDFRRFFRAYADDITQANSAALGQYDPADPEALELWGWITEVAFERGLQRYPHLAHDSADACLNLSASERMALFNSRTQYLSGKPNVADMSLADRH